MPGRLPTLQLDTIGPAPVRPGVRPLDLYHPMKMLKCLPLILCLTVSAAPPADEEFVGVGVELGTEGQNIVVKRILPDSPAAAQTDLRVGDRIVAVAQGKEPVVQVQNLVQTA